MFTMFHHRFPVSVKPRFTKNSQLHCQARRAFALRQDVSIKHGPRRYVGFPLKITATILLGGVAYYLYDTSPTSKTWSGGPLDVHRFQPFVIVEKEHVSSTSSIYTLRPLKSRDQTDPYAHLWKQGIWSVEFRQPQLQIARSYTPLPPVESSSPEELRFLIRREHKGEVSNYLDRLPIGATIDVRGPRIEYAFPNQLREVVFLAGGTGIAPAMQTAYAVSQRGRMPGTTPIFMRILWANRKREDCVGAPVTVPRRLFWLPTSSAPEASHKGALVKLLAGLEQLAGGNVTTQYFTDEEKSYIGPQDLLRNVKNDLATATSADKIILVSGPDGFVEAWAGKRQLYGTVEAHSPTQGLLGRLSLPGWLVVKL